MTPANGAAPAIRAWPWLLAILAIAIAARLVDIGYSLWTDEIASLKFAERPLALLWSDWMLRETNPPLYYTMLKGWQALFGPTDLAARLLSVVVGLAGIPLVYLIAKAAGGARAGLVAAALLAVSQQHVLYSQQVRGYILLHGAALTAIWGAQLFLRATDTRSRSDAIGVAIYISGCTLATYAHTTGVLVPIAISFGMFAWLLWQRKPLRFLLIWAAANLVVLIAWGWWGRISYLQAMAPKTISWIEPTTLPVALKASVQTLIPWQIGWGRLISLPLALIAFLAGCWRLRGTPGLLLPLVVLLAGALLMAMSLVTPVFLPRTIFWASGPFVAIVAIGICGIADRRLFAAALAVALALSTWGLVAWAHRPDDGWRTAVETIRTRDPDALVMVQGKGMMFMLRHYCPPDACALRLRTVPMPETWPADFPVDGTITEIQAQALLQYEGDAFVVGRGRPDTVPGLAAAGRPVGRAEIQPDNDQRLFVTRWQAIR
ncbi:glycosyltransferase family 39 protein [Sphingomonas sp. 1P06PA]|uniref:glycosyltransferase family 39 protein n=1 Tax=Sphingomonas sp. 1P06PA TaxID=554121 RepID=UPI0039A4925D